MTSDEFEILCEDPEVYTRVEQKDQDVGGGRITCTEIDEINAFKSYDKVLISGLRQDTFEYFIKTQAFKFKAIMFWKNKLVEDWSQLSTLKNIEFIGYFHNQRITKLWDMSKNESLKGLYISDFSRLNSLEGVEKAPNLERLSFGNAIWDKSVLNDIKALKNTGLKEFNFSGKRITDTDLTIFTQMPKLEVLNFGSRLYTTEQIAWLVAKLPNVTGHSMKPFYKFNLRDPEDDKDVLICGKRKPFLSSTKDALLIQRYVDEFEKLVQQKK